MRIQFLGTGAAEGIPALFCRCAFCRDARARGEVRSRAQVLLDGELSVDFPPDAFSHAAKTGADFSAIRYLLVTHSHLDHFAAGDLVFRGYKYASGMTCPSLDIYANRETLEVFREATRREMKPEIASTIATHEIRAFKKAEFGGWTVYPLAAKHTSRDPLVFLIEKAGKRVLHLHDTALLPEKDYEFLASLGGKPADLVTLDCTFLYGRADRNARHMGLYEDLEVLERLGEIGLADGATKRVITHFSHTFAPTAELLRTAEKEFGVIAAYDGMTLEI